MSQELFTVWVGIIAGVLTSASLLPQFIKLVRNKKAEDISLFYLILLSLGLGLWIGYGSLREDIPVIATNGFSLLVNLLMIIFGIRYKSKPAKN